MKRDEGGSNMVKRKKLLNLIGILLITFMLLLSVARTVGAGVNSVALSNSIYGAFKVSSHIE